MKTKKEPNARKEEAETVNKKPCASSDEPRALTDEELAQVNGGCKGPEAVAEGYLNFDLR